MGFEADADPNVIGAFEEDSEQDQKPLPRWATDWGQTNSFKCKPGTQCIGGAPNPLGELGLWVMKKTEPKYNPPFTVCPLAAPLPDNLASTPGSISNASLQHKSAQGNSVCRPSIAHAGCPGRTGGRAAGGLQWGG